MDVKLLVLVAMVTCSVAVTMTPRESVAGDGIIILQREVPPQPAYGQTVTARATIIDTSPDGKLVNAIGGHGLPSSELADMDFAEINTGQPQMSSLPLDGMSKSIMSNSSLENNRLDTGGHASARSMVPVIAGQVGPAVGAATSMTSRLLSGTTGTLNGLTGAIMSTTGR